MESSSDAIISVDLEGMILSWNRAAEEMFGSPAEEAVGKSIATLLPPEEVPGVLERVRSGEPVGRHDTTITTTSSALTEVSLSVSPIVDSSEHLIGASVTLCDVAEWKRTREALTRLAKVFIDSADPIVIEDVFGRIVEMNPEAELAYGYTRDEILGESIKTIIPPEQHKHADELLQRCLQGEQVRNVESVRQTRAGKTFPVLLTLSLITNEFGQPTGIATICKNISEQKRTEKRLHKAVSDLERINEELEDFVSVASHDLRSPLVTISGFSEIVSHECEQGLDVEKIQECVHSIGNGATRALALLESLREYSRVGRSRMQSEPVDLGGVMIDVLKNLEHDIGDRQARVEVAELPEVSGDRMRLLQLLQNLVANAIKFHGDQAPVVKVIANRDGDMWRISVEDSGIGIDTNYHDQIFAAFRRLHGQSEYEGSGIGLATCKKIVEQHDGQIWVESEPGKGATFHFTLPTSAEEK
jgi:PAS domain S-box-containing protein